MAHSPLSLQDAAAAMVASPRGILAADESVRTMSMRLEKAGVEPTADNRCAYRELLVLTPGLSEGISGVILSEETLRQRVSDGRVFPEAALAAGILPGIKVDTGAKPLAGAPGETVTEGLDGLRERLAEYVDLGARFAKWRAVISIDEHRPTALALHVNAHALARYAALCQEAGIVPIVEPEVLMDGEHTLERCAEVTLETLHEVFSELEAQQVALDGIVLKPNMVVPGKHCSQQATVDQVAEATVGVLRDVVPPAVPGIAFLSGGQAPAEATAHLAAMQRLGETPWQLTFSFGRALVDPALAAWRGDPRRVVDGQRALARRVTMNVAARQGRWTSDLEQEPALA